MKDLVVLMSDATTEVKDAATTVTTPVDSPAQEDTTSFAERYSDVLGKVNDTLDQVCLLYTSPSPRDGLLSRMPSSA